MGVCVLGDERRAQARSAFEGQTPHGKVWIEVSGGGSCAPEYEDCKLAVEIGTSAKRTLAFAAGVVCLQSAARTLLDAGELPSTITFRSVDTAAPDAWCIRATDCGERITPDLAVCSLKLGIPQPADESSVSDSGRTGIFLNVAVSRQCSDCVFLVACESCPFGCRRGSNRSGDGRGSRTARVGAGTAGDAAGRLAAAADFDLERLRLQAVRSVVDGCRFPPCC